MSEQEFAAQIKYGPELEEYWERFETAYTDLLCQYWDEDGIWEHEGPFDPEPRQYSLGPIMAQAKHTIETHNTEQMLEDLENLYFLFELALT